MIPFLIGAYAAFKLLFDRGVGSGKPAPPKKPEDKKPTELTETDAEDFGSGVDYVPEHQMVEPPKAKERRARKDRKPAEAEKPAPAAEKPKDEKKVPLPARKGNKGSYDDVMEDDPTGVGIDELEELNGPEYNPGEDEETEA